MNVQTSSVPEGELLWRPSVERVERSQLVKFTKWLKTERGLSFGSYDDLWRWSISDLDGFWSAIWQYFDVISDGSPETIVSGKEIFGAKWFAGTRTNYAEHILRHERRAAAEEVAFFHSTEAHPLGSMTWHELGEKVRKLATSLREMGVEPGDRLVSYMPNVPETAIAMLATVAIGAIWSSAAPEFGSQTVLDRFSQIEPKLIFAADGYNFGGKTFDRSKEIGAIVGGLFSLEKVIWTSHIGSALPDWPNVDTIAFETLLDRSPIAADDFRFERVPADHPLWVLFSSGTTGLPKAIVHGHAGMIVEHLKVMTLNCDLGPGSRMFFYSTTGWMMWNSVLSALITGSAAILYDGSPTHGGVDMLWRMAADCRATMFGASPTLVKSMENAAIRPSDRYDLSALDTILVGGSPSTPTTFKWFYDNIKPDIWVTSQSGGTEFCSGIAVGTVTEPVYAGEIQARGLGVDLHVWNDDGQDLIDQPGELVVLQPTPAMPLFLWGDEDGTRYHESYFADFPGVWRHGDLAKVNARGGVYVYGRSDATLNRYGVRIGSAEVYSVLEKVDGVADSLVICCEMPDGGYYMPLFIALKPGAPADEEVRAAAIRSLREKASPRHVPDEIHFVPAIPYTLTGKKMEVPVRRLIMGTSLGQAASRDAMADPTIMDWFVDFAGRNEIVARRSQSAVNA